MCYIFARHLVTCACFYLNVFDFFIEEKKEHFDKIDMLFRCFQAQQ